MAGPAKAIVLQANTVSCTNDIFQQCDTSIFLAAVGGGPLDVSLNFQTDKNGIPVTGGVTAGDVFSDDVTFSSLPSLIDGLGIVSTDIQLGGAIPATSQIGAVEVAGNGGFRGALAIDFTNAVSAVGFTTISLETNGVIQLFDEDDILIDTIASPSNTVLDYVGLVATGGERISRIVIDGDLHAIRDIQFNFAAIPEPGMAVLFGCGLLGMSAVRRRARKAARLV